MSAALHQLAEALATRRSRTPSIVLDALLPANLPVPPITLRAWLALERIGSPLTTGQPVGLEDALAALAAVIAPSAALAHWQDGTLPAAAAEIIGHREHALPALLTRIRQAFAPVPQDLPDDGDHRPPGVGWTLALAENLMAAYHLSLDAALDTPLAVAFCLRAAQAEREGAPLPGPSFSERDLLAALSPQDADKIGDPPDHQTHAEDDSDQSHGVR